MNIHSVGSTYGQFLTQTIQRAPEAGEIREAGRDNDGDSGDKGVRAVAAPPSSTVNSSGQRVGQVINAVA